jgi:hypothetical protein
MKIRTAQTAVSVVCLLTCALIVALWVRSIWVEDALRWIGSGKITLISREGVVTLSSSNAIRFSGTPRWEWESTPVGDLMPDALRGWHFRFDRNGMFVRFPLWLPVTIFMLSAAAPWIRWSFSLRTMMIASAAIALMLGLALYFGR